MNMKESMKELKYQLTMLYIVGVFCFMTFYSHDAYYDMSKAKTDVVIKLSAIYLLLMTICSVIFLFSGSKGQSFSLKKNINIMDIGILLFMATTILSVLVCSKKYAAVWGTEGFGMGAAILFLLVGVYFFASRNLKNNNIIIWSVIISGFVVFILGITDGFSCDIFGWKEHMTSPRADYISTIGNRDWLVGYLALVLPFAAVCYMNEKKRLNQVIYLIYFLLGFVNLYLTKSDGNLLVFGCAIPLVYMGLKNEEHWKKLWSVVLTFVAAGAVIEWMQWVQQADLLSISLMGWAVYHYIVYFIGFIAIAAIVFSKKIVGMHLEKLWIGFSLLVIIALFVIVIICFDETFGSHRGYIWMYVTKSYGQFDIVHKLFGWGIDCCRDAIYKFEGDYIANTWVEPTRIVNAHNEVLQYLITTGIFGMLSYCSIYVTTIYNSIKKEGHYLATAAAVSVWAYFCTALGNNPQALNYVILFCMLAIIRNNHLT